MRRSAAPPSSANNPKEIFDKIKHLLGVISNTLLFTGKLEAEVTESIHQLGELFARSRIEKPADVASQLHYITDLLLNISALKLKGEYKAQLENMLEEKLKQVMELSSVHQGLKLTVTLIGKCLAAINNYSNSEDIMRFLKTKSSSNFPIFYYIQHAVRNCLSSNNPRHYPNIAAQLDKPTRVIAERGVLILPSKEEVENDLRNRCVSFNIQFLLLMCAFREKLFQKETATFLVEICGADTDLRVGFSFFQKAVDFINPKKPETLQAFVFYLEKSKKTRDEILQLLETSKEKASGEDNVVKCEIAIDLIKSANSRPHAEICAEAIERSQQKVVKALENETPEIQEKRARMAEFLRRYQEGEDSSEIEACIKGGDLDEMEAQLLVEQAMEINAKFGKDLQAFITHCSTYVGVTPRV